MDATDGERVRRPSRDRQTRLSWVLAGAATLLLVGFLAGMSWAPGLWSHRLHGEVLTVGMVAGLIVIAACLLLTAIYLHRCRVEFDPHAQTSRRD
jgi:uncharacterized membrane protein (DUF485 family)